MADIFGGLDINLFKFQHAVGSNVVYNERFSWVVGRPLNYYNSSSSFEDLSDLIDIFHYVLRQDANSTSTGQFYGFRTINNYGDTECNVEFYYYAIPIEGDTEYIGYSGFTCPANTSEYYYDHNLNTLYLTSDNYSSMRIEMVIRSGSNFEFTYEVVPEGDWTKNQVENYYSLGYSNDLIQDYSDNAYDRGYNDGYSEGLETNLDVKEAYDLGYEKGYQDKEFTNNIFPNTFDLIGKGFEPITQVLVTEIAPNTTIGSIAFIPVSVAIVIFLLRSLIL